MNTLAPGAPDLSRPRGGRSNLWLSSAALLLGTALSPDGVSAQSFTVGSGTTALTTRTMTGADDVGRIEHGGAVTPPLGAIGVYMTGSTQTLDNLGLIETTGTTAFGIRSTGPNASIRNAGTIHTTGSTANGIYTGGSSAQIVNDGLIHSAAFGVRIDGGDTILTNNGDIVTDGPSAGVLLYGPRGTLLNYGTIETTTSAGVFGTSGATVVNHGSVLTGGFSGRAIEVGLGGRMQNYGLISTTGDFGEGMFNNTGGLDGLYAHNYGTVLTTGTSARGIYWGGNNGYVLNAGAIETHGLRAPGIMLLGDNAVIENDGSILTTGDQQVGYTASGIHTTGFADRALLINRGSIVATGTAARGILVEGTNSTIVNSGSILSAQSNAIEFVNGNAHLDLLAGTAIDGAIRFAGTGNTASFGPGLNALMRFTGAGMPGTVISGSNPAVIVGNSVAVLDRAGFALADDMSLALLGELAGAEPGPGRCVMQTVEAACGVSAWLSGVGGFDVKRAGPELAGYGYALGGLVAGLELVPGGGLTAGAFVGGAAARGEVTTSQDTDLSGGVVGGHLGFERANVFADFYAALGIVGIDSRRSVADNLVDGGLATASARTTGYAFAPSATLGVNLDTPLGVLTPSLRARYWHLQLDGYTESGAADELVVDARTVEQAELRLQLALTLAEGETATTTLRGGLDLTYRQSNVTAELAGKPVAFDPGNSGMRYRGFAGVDFTYQLADGASLAANSEVGFDSTGVSATGQLGYRKAF